MAHSSVGMDRSKEHSKIHEYGLLFPIVFFQIHFNRLEYNYSDILVLIYQTLRLVRRHWEGTYRSCYWFALGGGSTTGMSANRDWCPVLVRCLTHGRVDLRRGRFDLRC